jgi:hypothetical protein
MVRSPNAIRSRLTVVRSNTLALSWSVMITSWAGAVALARFSNRIE